MNLLIKDGGGEFVKAVGDGTDDNPHIISMAIDATGPVKKPIYTIMDTVGDGTGSHNMNVNGSVTPVVFKTTPPPGEIWRLARVIFAVKDGGGFDSGGWGNNGGSPLTNGIEFKAIIGGNEIVIAHDRIKTHFHLAGISYDITYHDWGSGDAFIVSRLTFTKAGQPIRLVGDDGDSLQMVINDDLTYLTYQEVSVQGQVE